MKRYLQTAILAAALMGTASAFAGNVQTDYDHSANFSQYKTYSWGKVKTTDPFFVTRVQDAVNQHLQAKGWTLAPTGGSVTVFATDNIHDQKEIQTMYDGLGGGWGGGWGGGGWGWGRWLGTGFRNRSVHHDDDESERRQPGDRYVRRQLKEHPMARPRNRKSLLE